jgi:hypothetical protein
MNFNSRFFKQGFKNFKGYSFKKDLFNVNKSSSYFNIFILNKIQTMNYISIANSYKLTNALFLSNNINTCLNSLKSETAENESTELCVKEDVSIDSLSLIRLIQECVRMGLSRSIPL